MTHEAGERQPVDRCDLCGAPAVGELSLDIGPEDVLTTYYCSEHVDRMLPGEVLGDG